MTLHYLILYTMLSLRSVFWDLYCAAPERRDTCDHSSEAKAFHDYVSDACLIHPTLAHSDIRDLLFHQEVKPLKCSSVV